jgi:hypothetical protein
MRSWGTIDDTKASPEPIDIDRRLQTTAKDDTAIFNLITPKCGGGGVGFHISNHAPGTAAARR